MTWKLFSIFRIAGIFPYLVSKQQRPLAARWQQTDPLGPRGVLSKFSSLPLFQIGRSRNFYVSSEVLFPLSLLGAKLC